jgi:hypothetical protein
MPPINPNRFFQAGAADPMAAVHVTADGEGVIAEGKGLGNRAVAWLKEALGIGKSANRRDILLFHESVQHWLGDRAGDMVSEQLAARLNEGKPLRGRHTEEAYRSVQAMQNNEAMATQAADLGDVAHPTPARGMIDDLVRQGALSEAGAAKLHTQGSPENTQLTTDIMRAVREAATQNKDQLLGQAPVLRAIKGAVDEAARRITTAENEALATRLSDLGDGTPASTTIDQLVEQRQLSQAGANALRRPDSGLAEAIKAAVLAAAKDSATNGAPQLGEATATIATMNAVALKAAYVQLQPESEGGLTTRLLDSAQGFLNDFGIDLPVDRQLFGKMTDNERNMAARNLAGILTGDTAGDPETVLKSIVAVNLGRPVAETVKESLIADGVAAQDAFAGLRLPANIDKKEHGAQPIETRLLTKMAEVLRKADDPSTGQVFDAALLKACEERLETAPTDAPRILSLVQALDLETPDRLGKLPFEEQRNVLDVCAKISASSVGLVQEDVAHEGEARTRAVADLADLATLEIREIRKREGCDEATAIDRLKQVDPDLTARMGRVLADGDDNPAPGAWLDTRTQLAAMREQVKTLAGSGEASGTDLQRLISAKLRGIALNVFDSAVKTLGKEPPVPFTVLGLGSTARGEASPYSDLEFAILLHERPSPEDQKYFLELTARVRDQIAAAGEHASRFNPEGFHFDKGISPLTTSEQTATGRLFLGTADDLVQAFAHDAHVQTTLVNAEWLYGGEVRRFDAGGRPAFTQPDESWRAVQDFHAKVGDHLNHEDGSGVQPRLELARKNLEMAELLSSTALQREDDGVVDVKEMARLPMMLVQGLAVKHGLLRDPDTHIAANSIDQRLTLLVEKKHISRKDADAIMALQDGLSKLRVRSHLMHGNQEDKVALTEEAGKREGLLYDEGLGKLVTDFKALRARVGPDGLNSPVASRPARSGLDIAGEYMSIIR